MLVRKLRLKHGWSQRQLAEMTGVTTRTIQRIERGQKPSVETAKALASVFEVDFSIFQPEQNEVDTMTSNDDIKQNSTDSAVTKEELEAMAYAKRVKEFFEFLLVYLVVLIVFLFAATELFSDARVIFIFAGIGIGVILQGLYAFGYISFLTPGWERRLIEKRLNRKL